MMKIHMRYKINRDMLGMYFSPSKNGKGEFESIFIQKLTLMIFQNLISKLYMCNNNVNGEQFIRNPY